MNDPTSNLPVGFKPIFRIREFEDAFGVGHTKTYELINDGEVEAVKVGSGTGITGESAFAWLNRLPRVEPKKAA